MYWFLLETSFIRYFSFFSHIFIDTLSRFLCLFPLLDLLQLSCLLVLLILAAPILISFYVMLSRAKIFGEVCLCLLISLEN